MSREEGVVEWSVKSTAHLLPPITPFPFSILRSFAVTVWHNLGFVSEHSDLKSLHFRVWFPGADFFSFFFFRKISFKKKKVYMSYWIRTLDFYTPTQLPRT